MPEANPYAPRDPEGSIFLPEIETLGELEKFEFGFWLGRIALYSDLNMDQGLQLQKHLESIREALTPVPVGVESEL